MEPAPAMIKKRRAINIEKSVRASLTMNQNPWPGLNNSGIFVVAIAVQMMTKSGTEARRTNNPMMINIPQIISKVPTRCAVKYGKLKPILANRSTPILGSIYFRNPWDEKIKPTARRINSIAGDRQLGRIILENQGFSIRPPRHVQPGKYIIPDGLDTITSPTPINSFDI
jgi:hypothetical protein